MTKLFTATVIMRLVEQNLLNLNDPLAHYFDSYQGGDRCLVTVRQLLSHTSGLPAETFLWRDYADTSTRRAAVLAQPLEAVPGSRSRYSCVGYLTLGLLAEKVLGRPLDALVAELVCAPLGMTRTRFVPLQPRTEAEQIQADQLKDNIAATEMRRIDWSPQHDPADPDPRGIVHDENAASLGGVSGNAGLFGPVRELLLFGRAFLTALLDDGPAVLGLSRAGAREMLTPQLPVGLNPDYQSGLGFRIDDRSFMGSLAGTGKTYGHTGFTGTSLVIDEARDLVLVLLTNRVHPSRTWSELNPTRRRLADLVAAHYPAKAEPGP